MSQEQKAPPSPAELANVRGVHELDNIVNASQSPQCGDDVSSVAPREEKNVGSGSASAPPPSPNSPKRILENEWLSQIVVNTLKLGLPLNVSQLAQLSILLVMMSFIGTFGTNALGGASLANGLMNATGYAFGGGLSGALETLLSHSYGRNPLSKLYGTHAQRMILLLLVVSLPLGCLVAHAGTILIWLGQRPEVVTFTAQYASVGMWALIPFMLLEVTRRYFAAQHMSTALTVAIVIAAVINVPLQMLSTNVFGFIGAPIAWTFLLVGMDVGLVVYLYVSGLYRNTWGGWNRDALRHWKPMLHLAAPSLGMTLCEWAALEVNTVLAGFAPPLDLAAFAITVQMAITMWTMPSGNYIAASVLVGNRVGEGRPLLGRRYAVCALCISFAISCIDVAGVLALGEALPRFFSNDPAVIERFMSYRWWVMLFHFGDAFQSTMLGVFRGMGMQSTGAKVVGMSFGVVGVPFGVIMFFTGIMDVRAMWIGPIVGLYGAGLPLFVYYFKRTEWALLRPHHEDVPAEVDEEEETYDGKRT